MSQSARYEDPAYAAILTELGAADSDQVYAFDAEVTQRSTMYRDLIGALLRLTGGELDLQDVRESGENADLEGPGGTWRVSFTLNGHPYQYLLAAGREMPASPHPRERIGRTPLCDEKAEKSR